MDPAPDHGESSYVGPRSPDRAPRADHRRRLRASGARSPSPTPARAPTSPSSTSPRSSRTPTRPRAGCEQAGRTCVLDPDRPDRRAARARAPCRAGGHRARRPRHPGEQRRVPDGAPGVDRGHHVGGPRPDVQDEPLRAVLGHADRPGAPGRGRVILNNSSIQAYQPSETLLDYASTKAAINNFTVNLAAELGSRGIRVNAVAPGPIWTPLQPATQFPEKVETFGADTPLGSSRPAGGGRTRLRVPRGRLDRVLRVRHRARRHRWQARLLSRSALPTDPRRSPCGRSCSGASDCSS